MRVRYLVGLVVLAMLVAAGCQQAKRYSYKKSSEHTSGTATESPTPPTAEPPEIEPILLWTPQPPVLPGPPVPLDFVSEDSDPARWAALPHFWNPSLLVNLRGVPVLLRSPLEAATILAVSGPTRVQIKVPRGLENPKPYISEDNLPTLEAWLLGRRLFYDPSYLVDKGLLACATCHDPATGFASRRSRDGDFRVNTPSLLNVLYRKDLYWDGRESTLEACLQRTPQDEFATPVPGEHFWPGAIKRLYNKPVYIEEFRRVYGVYPNQDNVGRALGTFLRTLLVGNSLHDRALAVARAEGKPEPEVPHFQAALTPNDLKYLERSGSEPLRVAQDLHRGYLLFHDKVQPVQTACVRCHGDSLFSDRSFHNLSLDFDHRSTREDLGRFGTLPPGRRTQAMMGAYRTPSLRDVARTPPYFHPGHVNDLRGAVEVHLDPRWTTYLDPLFLVKGNSRQQLKRPLIEADMEALLLYLRALNSEEIPRELTPTW